LNHAEPITPHPQQKALLTLRTRIDSCIKERAKQPAVAQQKAEELIVVNVYRVKPSSVEEIVSVNKNGNATAMSKLPGRRCPRIELHFIKPSIGLRVDSKASDL
jgi:hypothetical protein